MAQTFSVMSSNPSCRRLALWKRKIGRAVWKFNPVLSQCGRCSREAKAVRTKAEEGLELVSKWSKPIKKHDGGLEYILHAHSLIPLL